MTVFNGSGLYTETEAREIRRRNEEISTEQAVRRQKARRRVEDVKLARELGLPLNEVIGDEG